MESFMGFRWVAVLCMCGLGGMALAETSQTQTSPLGDLPDNPHIRVLLVEKTTSLTLTPDQAWTIKSPAGQQLGLLTSGTKTAILETEEGMKVGSLEIGKGDGIVLEATTSGGLVKIDKVPVGVGWWWESAEDRLYEGRLEIRSGAKGLSAILSLPLERYLRGVVPSEIGLDSPLAAYGAQAVAARSAAVLALTTGQYSGPDFDICSDVACQVFSGIGKANPVADAAIEQTKGVILTFEGRPLSAYYASNCGGHTEDIRNVWPDRSNDRGYWGSGRFDGAREMETDLTTDENLRKWLASSPVTYCNPEHSNIPKWASSNFRWTREISADDLTSRVAEKKDIGRVTAVRAVKRGHSGRMIEAEFVGERGTYKVGPELAIRQVWQPPLRSATMVVDAIGSADAPTTFTVTGAGWGHGVGMCQSGAIGMAHAGRTFEEILKHYFSNAKLEKLY